MKKNLYYRTVFSRTSSIRAALLDFFLATASFPRMLIEVFIRKNFGERYFSYATALTITVIMLFYPVVISSVSSFFTRTFSFSTVTGAGQLPTNPFSNGGGILGSRSSPFSPNSNYPYAGDAYGRTGNYQTQSSQSGKQYIAWYLFLFCFIWASFLRHQEVKRNPSVFDFARFSRYTGDIHPFFSNLKVANKNVRAIEIFYEPLGFFIFGVFLWAIGQSLGWVLILASLCYGLSYAAAYMHGDHFVMDKIDEMILNEQMEAAFVHDDSPDKTKGVRFYAKKPNGETLRRKVAEALIEEDDEDSAEAK